MYLKFFVFRILKFLAKRNPIANKLIGRFLTEFTNAFLITTFIKKD